MSELLLPRITTDAVRAWAQSPVDASARIIALPIVEDVRDRGQAALREYAERFEDINPGADLWLNRSHLQEALDSIPVEQRLLLERTAERIAAFAGAQRASLTDLRFKIPGGHAGHRFAAVQRAGCYAPGGRYPLPSSVLMTAVTARVAGVATIIVASPRPATITLAAAAVAGADAFLCAGGAQAIAALAYGTCGEAQVDVIVGPGNRYVTAAKEIVFGQVGIDMLAGPSELLVLADDSADPDLIAADLLAQAEHDPDARPLLIATSQELLNRVEEQLQKRLAQLPTADVAQAALRSGFSACCPDPVRMRALSERLAPEHLALHVHNPGDWQGDLSSYGALFLGDRCAEVLGDYGAGPNHVLPTGGSARYSAGLSVQTFLRMQSWMQIEDAGAAQGLYADAAAFARLEGLEGHARAAESRLVAGGIDA